MILTEGRLRKIISEEISRSQIITFDFDDTLASRGAKNLKLSPRRDMTDKLVAFGQNPRFNVFVVTRRDEQSEGQETVQFLSDHGLIEYVDGIRYTSGMPKKDTLVSLGSSMHHDDNIEDVNDARDVGIIVHHVT
jgi:acid phosphatase class B